MHRAHKTATLWIVLLVALGVFWRIYDRGHHIPESAERFRADVVTGRVASLRIEPTAGDAHVEVLLRDGERYSTEAESVAGVVELAHASSLPYTIDAPHPWAGWVIIATWIPAALIALLFFFFMRSLRGVNKAPSLVAVIEARIAVAENGPRPRLQGLDVARQHLISAAEALKGDRPGPRKILLSGPPGTGKTTLWRWAASETGLPTVFVPGSDVVNFFIGVGAARVRRLLEVAGSSGGPCLAVIEDIDAFAARRPPPSTAQDAPPPGHEQEQALIELCNHLDGVRTFPPNVLFVATTNRPDRLDEAFVRPGRIDLHLRLSPGGGSELVPPPEGLGSLAATAT